MTICSFIAIDKKSLLIEKDRYRKHNFLIEIDNGLYIYSRFHGASFIDKNKLLNLSFLDFISLIANEIKSNVFFSFHDLKNKESELSVINFIHKKPKITKNNYIEYGELYKFTFHKNNYKV